MIEVRFASAAICGFGLALVACHSRQPPITYNALVGTYVYNSHDPENRPTDHEWDRLTLSPDGKYDLVQGAPTKTKSDKTGRGYFREGEPAEVELDHAGFPIRVERGEIRLVIDDDVGIWYLKQK
jgi:hypothetical protein